jgi:SAM-dependent methyltransferase
MAIQPPGSLHGAAKMYEGNRKRERRRAPPSRPVYFALFSVLVILYLVYAQLYTSSTTSQHHQYNLIDNEALARHSTQETVNSKLSSPIAVARPFRDTNESYQYAWFDERRKRHGRGIGGIGDPKHLGGFHSFNKHTVSPFVWKQMVEKYNIRSVLDIGCGRGWSTLWFRLHGLDSVCVDGSRDAIRQTVLPADAIVEHDFTLGPWWPEKTYDAVWASDFIQMVSLPFQANYLAAFRKAALIFVTAPQHGGWHAVQTHPFGWWIRRFELLGFRYDEELTFELHKLAKEESDSNINAPDGSTYGAQSIISSLLVCTCTCTCTVYQYTSIQ